MVRPRLLKRLLPLLLFLVTGATVTAQSVDDMMERYMEQNDDEEALEELMDEYSDALEDKMNLNDTMAYVPEWLLSSFQHELLRAYIMQHGYLLTWDELYLVNGMDSSTVERLMRFCTLEKPTSRIPHLRDMLRRGRHNLVVGTSLTMEKARGYKEDIYEGKPYRLYGRYRFKYKDYLSVQLSVDKDAGEGFFYGSRKQGFDLYSGHVMISNIGWLKGAVVGRYRLQFGQGLTLWSGSRAFLGWNASGIRYGRGICASSPFAENDYLQGTAVAVSLPYGLEMTAFYSYALRDASVDSLSGNASSISSSGYHRTTTEIAKRGSLGEHLYGGNLQWNRASLHLGVTAYRTYLTRDIQPKEYVYNHYTFRGNTNTNAGLDFSYRWRKVLLYGEGALSQGGGRAGLVGLDFWINAENTFSIVYRNYSAKYYNLHSSTWGHQSQPQNESGLRLALQSRLPLKIDMLIQADLYRHPRMRYSCYSPSTGANVRTELTRQFSVGTDNRQSLQLRLSHRYSNFMRNDSQSSAAEYSVETYNRHLLYGDVDYRMRKVSFRTRVGWSSFRGELGDPCHGIVLLQDVQAQLGDFSVGGRVALFDVESYDARLYVAERGLEYDNGGTSLYGKGMRFYLLARYNLKDRIIFGLKYSVTAYVDRETVGSGYELIDKPYRQQLRLQVRVRF